MEDVDGTMTTLEDQVCNLEQELEVVKSDLAATHERNKALKAESLQMQVSF